MTEEKAPSNESKPQDGFKSFLSSIEGIVKTIAGVGIIFYVIGFIIVRTYLAKFGIDDMGLLVPRYISVGLYYSAFFTSFVIFFSFCIGFLYQMREFYPRIFQQVNDVEEYRSNPQAVKEDMAQEDDKHSTVDVYKILGMRRDASNFTNLERAKWLFLRKVGRLLNIIQHFKALAFITLLFLLSLLGTLSMLIQLIYGGRYISSVSSNSSILVIRLTEGFLNLKSWLGNSLLVCFVASIYCFFIVVSCRDENGRFINPDFMILAFLFPLIMTPFLLQNLQEYSLSVYPLVDRAIGGGKATQVQLVAELPDKTKTPSLGEILPINSGSNTKTVPVCLIEQSDKNYYVLLGADGKQLPKNCILPNPDSDEAKQFRAIQIDKGLVKGIVYIKS